MDESSFWSLIDNSTSQEDAYGYLYSELSTASREDILQFYYLLTKRLAESCTFPLLAANFAIESYVSDDGFRSFRAWLISQGSDKYFKAVADPQTIAEWLDKSCVDEIDGDQLLSIPRDVYENSYGDGFPCEAKSEPEPSIEIEWPESKEAYRCRWPKLVDKFWDDDRIREMHE